MRAEKVDNSDGNRLTIPNFERLQREGIFVRESHQERVLPDGLYRTCPGLIQMTTGKRIAAHGVRGNHDCDNGEFGDYPVFFRRLKELRPTIRVAAAESTSAVVTIILESCDGWTQLPSCVNTLMTFEPTPAGDRAGRDRVLQWLAAGSFDVVWYHPHEVDRVGHASGWDRDPIDDAVETLDAEIIRPLLEAVQAREAATLERWMIVVAADHGGHNAFNTWDLPATIYNYLGLTPNPAWPSTDGASILDP